MSHALLSKNEPTRLARLRALNLLDTPSEPLYDSFVRAAAAICATPMAAIVLVDESRLWLKAQVGLGDLKQAPREHSFCEHTVADEDYLEVGDAFNDARFSTVPLVRGPAQVRFYAGAPLVMDGEIHLGTLCVLDRQPRRLTDGQRAALQALAESVSQALMLSDSSRSSAAVLAVQHSERRYQQLADSSPFGIFFTDAQGKGSYSNDRLREIFGVPTHQALMHGWSDIIHPDDRQSVARAWSAATNSGEHYDLTYRITRPDRTLRHVRACARPTRDEHGAITGWVGVADDITDRLMAESRLREEYLERERLQRHADELRSLLQERNAMIDVLAHEVRQPLNSADAALASASVILADRCQGTAKDDVAKAREVLASVIEGVNNTLAVSTALMSGETVPVDTDVQMLLRIAVGDVPAGERQRIQIVTETPVRTVWADVGLMRMALRNLLMNALRFSAAGAPVVLRVSDAEAPAVLNIDVADQGRGIAPEIQARIFERGVRGLGAAGLGTGMAGSHGLGLYIARRAMELQKGEALVHSTGPAGTVMRLRLFDA